MPLPRTAHLQHMCPKGPQDLPGQSLSHRRLLLLLSRFSHVQLCATPIDSSPPGSAIPGILQARTLEWVAISYSKGSSLFRDQTHISFWRRQWQPTPVLLPGESQGWQSLVGCCLWGRKDGLTRLKRLSSSLSCGMWDLRS